MDRDELNNRLFSQFRVVYESISKNARTHGYAKSPDFHSKQDKLQRLKQAKWLKTRGKDAAHASTHVILNNRIDFITV